MSHSVCAKQYEIVHALPVWALLQRLQMMSPAARWQPEAAGWAGGHAGSVFLSVQEPNVTSANCCFQSHSGPSNDKSIRKPIVSA